MHLTMQLNLFINHNDHLLFEMHKVRAQLDW